MWNWTAFHYQGRPTCRWIRHSNKVVLNQNYFDISIHHRRYRYFRLLTVLDYFFRMLVQLLATYARDFDPSLEVLVLEDGQIQSIGDDGLWLRPSDRSPQPQLSSVLRLSDDLQGPAPRQEIARAIVEELWIDHINMPTCVVCVPPSRCVCTPVCLCVFSISLSACLVSVPVCVNVFLWMFVCIGFCLSASQCPVSPILVFR